MVAPPAAIAAPAAPVAEAVSYGSHALQEIDFYRPADESAARSPLIVFVHGGAWAGGDKSDSTGAAKIRHYTEAGYALASVNYRLLPEAEIERQAEDVAAAVAQLVADSKKLGIDPHQIVLMGHSAGAHLSALIATDPRYLAAHDLRPSDIAGAILLDGPAYDVPLQIRDAGPFLGIAYQLAFGSGYARQDALSPAMHADGENARRFFMLHVERADAKAQAHALGDALTEAGTDARVSGFPGRGMEGHNLLNAMLGRSDSPATVPVDEWLAETFTSAG
ncbi:hypothetical protein AB433_04160 [Croceicoccus naphthovorans]|uniref:BD-FAE-like domain-containing protein n=2 Tax=Croceicoccus naphthovorans TaxID=1348774 RepID=A0A0G3XLN7_9SPHN|nr:hypothetical protein AB433_04160 [Croceicoccus naphthovorans]